MKTELAKLLRTSTAEHRAWRHDATAHLRELVGELDEVVTDATRGEMRVLCAGLVPAPLLAGPATNLRTPAAYVYLEGAAGTLATLPTEVQRWCPTPDRCQVALLLLVPDIGSAGDAYPLRVYRTVAEYRNDGTAFEFWNKRQDMQDGFRSLVSSPRSPLVQALAEYDTEQEILDE